MPIKGHYFGIGIHIKSRKRMQSDSTSHKYIIMISTARAIGTVGQLFVAGVWEFDSKIICK